MIKVCVNIVLRLCLAVIIIFSLKGNYYIKINISKMLGRFTTTLNTNLDPHESRSPNYKKNGHKQ